MWELSKRNQQCFSVFSTIFKHSRVVSSTQKNVTALDFVSCSKIFLRAGNNHVVLKNSTEHAETLFIALFFSGLSLFALFFIVHSIFAVNSAIKCSLTELLTKILENTVFKAGPRILPLGELNEKFNISAINELHS